MLKSLNLKLIMARVIMAGFMDWFIMIRLSVVVLNSPLIRLKAMLMACVVLALFWPLLRKSALIYLRLNPLERLGLNMVRTQTVKQYSISDEMPRPDEMPHGETTYNKIYGWHDDIEFLKYLIETEVSNLEHALNKYDHATEPQNKTMCDDLKVLKTYLQRCYIELVEGVS